MRSFKTFLECSIEGRQFCYKTCVKWRLNFRSGAGGERGGGRFVPRLGEERKRERGREGERERGREGERERGREGERECVCVCARANHKDSQKRRDWTSTMAMETNKKQRGPESSETWVTEGNGNGEGGGGGGGFGW
ncbi:hypothetical protein CGRA01v4_14790 [Colletotrichum graminicola]|nr:hypothetical protein CGRA01v4_14790 [Colletotrichum graminicola]